MIKKSALQRIESHEKLCRIMQKQTFEQIKEMKDRRDKLYLYYQVKRGTRLAEFRVGTTYQQTLADFTTPE